MSGEKFIFPVADGTVKLSGGDQVLRTSIVIRDRPDGGEEQGNLQGESDGSSSSRYDGDAQFIYRHHVEPRVKLHVPKEESFLISAKHIDVTRTTNTPLDVMLEKISTIIGTLMEIENCQICGQVSQDSLY